MLKMYRNLLNWVVPPHSRPALRGGVKRGGATALSSTKIEPLRCPEMPAKKFEGRLGERPCFLPQTGPTPRFKGREVYGCHPARGVGTGGLTGADTGLDGCSRNSSEFLRWVGPCVCAHDGRDAAAEGFCCSLSSCSYTTPPTPGAGCLHEMGSGGASKMKYALLV